ncbi:MAG: hypothetical protein ABSG93_18840 [Solirubrobacteraceae bacterium]|jgi:hypothetical protein
MLEAADRFVWRRFQRHLVDWRDFAAFWAGDVDTGGCRRLGMELGER